MYSAQYDYEVAVTVHIVEDIVYSDNDLTTLVNAVDYYDST